MVYKEKKIFRKMFIVTEYAALKKQNKGDIVIASVCLSVRPLCYLLLNYWAKFNQIYCVSYSHDWGVHWQNLFCPAHWGSGEGSKGQISLNFNYKVNFKDFHTKLCVFSQMIDTKHIRRNFYSVSSGPRVGLGGT